jgi:hypothetical protein
VHPVTAEQQPRAAALPEAPLLRPDPHLWPSAAFDPVGRIRFLEAALTRVTAERDAAVAENERLEHEFCSALLHDSERYGRISVPNVVRALLNLPLPWCSKTPDPCMNPEPHDPPRGCVHYGRSGIRDRHDKPGRGDSD